MKTNYLFIVLWLYIGLNYSLFAQSSGTSLLIGQTFQNEFEGYVAGIGTVPAGSSHYGELYSGTINQGDDGKFFDDSSPYLNWVNTNYPGATILIAISIKDNPLAGGYGHLNPNDPQNYDPSGVYKATNDLAYTDKWDSQIRMFANKFKSYPQLNFIVRLGYEVNMLMMANASGMDFIDVLNIYNDQGINIYELSQDEFNSTVSKSHIDLDAYHDAYNKMATIIRDEQSASNVKFAYHPVRGFGETKLLYPGDQYVDYIAFSTFNHDLSVATDETNQDVRSIGLDGSRLDDNLKKSMDWASQRKPLIIAEAAYQKAPDEWIGQVSSPHSNPFLEYLDRLFEVAENYDMKALAYINSDWKAHEWGDPWTDSRVEAFSDVKNYWVNNVINNPRYIHYNGTGCDDCPSCLNGIKDGDEEDIDCGGSCPNSCNSSGDLPSAPTNLIAIANSNSQISLSWTDQSDNESGFYIERNGIQIAQVSVNETSFTDSNLTSSTTYSYRVRAYNAEGNSNYSNEATATTEGNQNNDCPSSHPYYACGQCWEDATQAASAGCTDQGGDDKPDAPVSLVTTAISSSQINLSWVDQSDNETGFSIERNGTQIAQVSSNIISYEDKSGLSASTTYTYSIRAFNSHGNSAYSNNSSATTEDGDGQSNNCPPSHPYFACGQCWEDAGQATSGGCSEQQSPSIPTGLSASVNGNEILASWNAVVNADTYTIKYGPKSGIYSESVSGLTSSSYTLSGLTDQTTYYITVSASNESGISEDAQEINATINISGLGNLIVKTSQTANSFHLSWNNVTNASGYKLEKTLSGNSEIIDLEVSETEYTESNPLEETDYTYSVTAYNNDESVTEGPFTFRLNAIGDKIEGKFTPKNGKTLLAIGQDLFSLAGYRYGDVFPEGYDFDNLPDAGEGSMPEPGAAVSYLAFYMLTQPASTNNGWIEYGAMGMDNNGTPTNIDTDWGAGPLNAYSAAAGWKHSSLILALSIIENWEQGGLSGISSGNYEANIDKLALFCNSFPEKKIYIRIGFEFDGRWNGPDLQGGLYPAGYHKTNEFKTAFRHIVTGMRNRGVSNVAFVWQSATSLVDDVLDAGFDYGGNTAAARENLEDWYPGDDYVDWMGISWFIAPQEAKDDFGVESVGIPNQDELADEMLNLARAHNKPVMIAEATPQGYDLYIMDDPDAVAAGDGNKISRASTSWTYEGASTFISAVQSGTQPNAAIDAASAYKSGTWFYNMEPIDAWNKWHQPFFDYIHNNSDVIRAVTYINANWVAQSKFSANENGEYPEGYWGDSRIEANPIIRRKWLEETNNSSFWLLGSPNIDDELLNTESSSFARSKTSVNNENVHSNNLSEKYKRKIIAFPNPAKNEITLTNIAENEVYKIFDIKTSQLVLEGKGNKIDLSKLRPGLYFLKIPYHKVVKILKK